MKLVDRYLQSVRIKKAKAYIRKNDSILDIGSADGTMFEKLRTLIGKRVGVEPTIKVTMLAVLEHIPTAQQTQMALDCHRFLKPGGRVIITVPSPQVDYILDILLRLKLIDGMSLEEHYGFKPEDTERIFRAPFFTLIKKRKFQFGLNNLFVFERLEPEKLN